MRLRGGWIEAGLLAQSAIATARLLFITFYLACLAIAAAHAGLAMRSFGMIGFFVGGRSGRHRARNRLLLTRVNVPGGNDHVRMAVASELEQVEKPSVNLSLVTCHLSLVTIGCVADWKGVARNDK